jgi:glucose-1-phosphate adenylyltransferase
MSRKHGGLRMLPPFGLPQYHTGNYNGTIEALNAVSTYIRRIPQKHVVLLLGNMAANIDLDAVIRQHEKAGTDVTAICAGQGLESRHSNYLLGEDGLVQYIDLFRTGEAKGFPSLEGYVFNKDKLLELMDVCRTRNLYRFHQDAMTYFLYEAGGKMDVYLHPGYARIIRSVDEYYQASRDVLDPVKRRELFPADRPVRTKIHEDVSTYYGEHAKSRNSLVGDNCIIEGDIEDCIIFSGCHIGAGAKLRGCILMRDCVVGENAKLDYIISDKQAVFSPNSVLVGSPNLPTVVPKDAHI